MGILEVENTRILGELKIALKSRLQGDPGGYPCHDNAVRSLNLYLNRTQRVRPLMRLAPAYQLHDYWRWRQQWIDFCLLQMRPDGTMGGEAGLAYLGASVSRLEGTTYDPPLDVSGF